MYCKGSCQTTRQTTGTGCQTATQTTGCQTTGRRHSSFSHYRLHSPEMIRLHLVFSRLSASKASLALPLGFRIVFFLIAALLAVSMISVKSIGAIPLILCILTFAGGMYKESWIMDNDGKTATHYYGLLFLYGHKTIPYEFIQELALYNFREIEDTAKGFSAMGKNRMISKSLARLVFILKDGDSETIEIQENRRSSKLKETAEQLSTFIAMPLSLLDS